MTTVFPGAIDSYTTKVDGVTNVLAAHVNDLQDAIVAIETVVIAQAPNPNLLYHTLTYDIWPDGTTFSDVSDDTYVAGLWNALWTGNAPDVTGETPSGPLIRNSRWLKCLIDTNGTQAGFVQFLTADDTKKLRGKTLSFSVDARGFNVSNLRCAILKWTGTADSVTSDVVATWATGNPTLATNWNWLGDTPVSQALTGHASIPDRIVYEGAEVPDDSTVNNLAVFVWTPDSENSTDYFGLANAKLEIGVTATDFVARSFEEEMDSVNFFYQQFGGESANEYQTMGLCISTTSAVADFRFSPKRIAPTITFSAVTHFALSGPTGTRITMTNLIAGNITKYVTTLTGTVAAGLTAGNATIFLADNNTNARIKIDARL